MTGAKTPTGDGGTMKLSLKELFKIRFPYCPARGEHEVTISNSCLATICKYCDCIMPDNEALKIYRDIESLRRPNRYFPEDAKKEIKKWEAVIPIIFPPDEDCTKRTDCTCPTLLNGHWDGCPVKKD